MECVYAELELVEGLEAIANDVGWYVVCSMQRERIEVIEKWVTSGSKARLVIVPVLE